MKLNEYLKENYIQQKALVDKLGLSAPYVHRLVHGLSVPSIPVAYKIEKFTRGKVSVYDWLEER